LQATRTIPIVFVNVADPIGSGFIANLPRPGGNVTGFIPIEAVIQRHAEVCGRCPFLHPISDT
jgi:ABC-type uncharacterized transport system substrate-binding protein